MIEKDKLRKLVMNVPLPQEIPAHLLVQDSVVPFSLTPGGPQIGTARIVVDEGNGPHWEITVEEDHIDEARDLIGTAMQSLSMSSIFPVKELP